LAAIGLPLFTTVFFGSLKNTASFFEKFWRQALMHLVGKNFKKMSQSEIKQSLRKLEFPICCKEALPHIRKSQI